MTTMSLLSGKVVLHHNDCLGVLAEMPAASIDAVVTDPPYELGFMGRAWDKTGIAFRPETWALVLRVLKPGGHLVAFGAPRNYHRMACAIEDAGFEVRDSLMWVFGSGFPKSLNVSKAIESGGGRPEDIRRMEMGDGYEPSGRGRVNYDHGSASAMNGEVGDWQPRNTEAARWQGWGTALKPAYEPIILARKLLAGTVAETVQAHGTGALNIDACRVATADNLNGGAYADVGGRAPLAGDECGVVAQGMFQPGKTAGREFAPPLGRWPANLIHDGSEEVLARFPDSAASKAGNRGLQGRHDVSSPDTQRLKGYSAGVRGHDDDGGSAARFFYCAKANAKDRAGSKHPTVKPIALMRYLCRLITPPGGVILDPFAGSGTTGRAAFEEGFNSVLIEREAEYYKDILRRMNALERNYAAGPLFAEKL